ncbi:MAG: glycosyltransferase family 1 protein [Spirochaetaceae bacterium]|jgi:glycosyltransferase involved in cell wall biosynthesis|nr:glycosyltransferase family 1 protein [Spirochaetaceae bacterium]
MNITLTHYHLRPGGVTQVLLHQARALLEAGEDVLVLSGEAPVQGDEWDGVPVTVVPGLHYDRFRRGEGAVTAQNPARSAMDGAATAQNPARKPDFGALALEMERAIRSRWRRGADIVHVHNPLIRKNSLLSGALFALAGTMPLFLQNHDLAEDFRPDVYSPEPYPENCHYAVINSRDYRFLREAGLKSEGLHLLPNEVRTLTVSSGLPKTRYLYPVRGIRRKNIGELLLFSLFCKPFRSTSGPGSAVSRQDVTAALTQPPTTEQDAPVYRRWKALAGELDLPAEFETGLNVPFADVLGTALAVITTSIKEGFGFSFLEPWTADLAVMGRRIDYVCRDFEEAGLRFDSLYAGLDIPADYAEPDRLREKAEEALSRVYRAFGSPLPASVSGALDAVFSFRDTFDFGSMDEEQQERILRLAAGDKLIRNRIKQANPFLQILEDWRSDPDITGANREAVLKAYSREKILHTLYAAYQKVPNPVVQRIDRSKLLELYLDPARLSLVGISRE